MGPQRPFGLHEAFIRALRRIDLVVVLVKAHCFLLEWIAIEHLQDPQGHLVTIRWDEGDPCRRFTHLAEPAFPTPVASRTLRHQKAFCYRFNALWRVLSKNRYQLSTPAEGLHNVCTIGLNQGLAQREVSSSFANGGTNTGSDADLSSDWGGIGDLAVPCSHERPAKDRPVDL